MTQTISKTIFRRFILGKQGLWPGRRWSGKAGTAAAIQAVESVQIDPVSVVAHSHDLALWGRVADFQPAHLAELIENERQFFDYGGLLFIYPIEDLPYWRPLMERRKADPGWAEFAAANPALLDSLRERIRENGPVRNREMEGNAHNSYRSGKDSGYALYHLWLTGELMTRGRRGIERVYDLLENVAPAHLQWRASEAEMQAHFARKTVAQEGMINERAYRLALYRLGYNLTDLQATRARLKEQVEAGELGVVQVEGQKDLLYYLQSDADDLRSLQDGQIPAHWQPLGSTTTDEITFLSPLEYVSARGRARMLFDFDYTWEIYKPAAIRKYGPYTMPVLYGDRLAARMDSRMDRAKRTLVINLFPLEEWFTTDDAFVSAAAKGLANLARFVGAERVDMAALDSSDFRARLEAGLQNLL